MKYNWAWVLVFSCLTFFFAVIETITANSPLMVKLSFMIKDSDLVVA